MDGIVAGTFLVTGLTDDSFGSLSPDLLRQFMTEFKMPEQFAKIGDRIVAIPMISEEQQKQTVLEEKSSIVNENTSGMAVDGHIGTWHTIDHKEIDGHTFWLMEHDTYELAHALIDAIYVHGQDSIEIVWKFKDIFEDMEGKK